MAQWEFMLISVSDLIFLCGLVSLGEMFLKRAYSRCALSHTAPRCANGTRFAFKHKLTDIWKKF